MKALVLPVGPPGCGKSFLLERLFPKEAILRLDDYRLVITGDESDMSCDRTAVAVRTLLAEGRLGNGLPTVIDATNALAQYRHPLIEMAAGHAVPVIAIWWRISVNECMRHQSSRQRQVPRERVEHFHTQITEGAADLRATTHLRIEIDETGHAVVRVGVLGNTMNHLVGYINYACDLVDRSMLYRLAPTPVVFDSTNPPT